MRLKVKSYTEYLKFNIHSKMGFMNITPNVDEALRKSAVKEGKYDWQAKDLAQEPTARRGIRAIGKR